MPAAFGGRPLWLSADAALQYLRLDWAAASHGLLAAASKYVRQSDVVWDIGSNVGVFAVAAAHRAGPQGSVLALEADPFLASLPGRRHSLCPVRSDCHT